MSRIPYAWRRWAAESRMMGVEPGEIRRRLDVKGYDGGAELAAIESHPYVEAGGWMAERLRKLESVLDMRNELARLGEDAGGIARRTGLTADAFRTDFYARNRPVLIEGMIDRWPARDWTPACLASRCGDALVDVMDERGEGSHHEDYVKGRARAVPLRDFVEMVTGAGETNRFYLVAKNDLLQRPEVAALWSDIGDWPPYLDAGRARQDTSFWLGPAGTITPLHHDAVNILFTQIYGRKSFKLFSPLQTHLLYNELNLFSEVDAEHPDLDRFPRYALARPIDLVLEPGQTLFIPVGWWHHVRALEVSISLSFTNFAFPNKYVWRNPNIDRVGT